MARLAGFISDVQTIVTQQLQFADAWSALQQEFNAMTTNGVTIAQTDLDAIFGANVVTVAQWNAALTAQQSVVDFIHVSATAAKLYRLKR